MLNRLLLSSTSLLILTVPAFAENPEDIFTKGTIYGDARYRYETVDQDGISQDADASTFRLRAGLKTGTYADFQGSIELDMVGTVGADSYNSTTNGKAAYPIVADPVTTELNQLWLSWAGIPQTSIKLGRQAINLDNQRFIGTVGWRQNDQNFDAAVIENKSIENLSLLYGYVAQINRINGHKHPQGTLETDTHALHAAYAFAPWLNFSAYGYWFDIDESSTLSSKTYGLRLTGEAPISESFNFFYEVEGAEQSDHANNLSSYNATYYHIAPGVKWNGLSVQVGVESLEGDGTNAFQTPAATLHAFNGWADKFLSTPADGLEDYYGKVSYKVSGFGPWVDNTVLDVVYHDFGAENTNDDYGSEWNLQISRTFKIDETPLPFKEWTVAAKYADYDAEDLNTDTQKMWLTVGTKF